MIRIVLAEDHRMLRQGLRLLLEAEPEFKVAGEADDGLQAIKLVSELHPDVLVTDIRMPGADGITVTEEAAKVSPETRVVVLSLYGNVHYASRALEAGARGYVLKDAGVDDLIRAIKTVLKGGLFLSPPLSEKMVEDYRLDTRAQE